MSRVELGAVNHLPWFSLTPHDTRTQHPFLPPSPPARAHFGFGARPLQAWRTAQLPGSGALTDPAEHTHGFLWTEGSLAPFTQLVPTPLSPPISGKVERPGGWSSPGLGTTAAALCIRGPQPVFSELLGHKTPWSPRSFPQGASSLFSPLVGPTLGSQDELP